MQNMIYGSEPVVAVYGDDAAAIERCRGTVAAAGARCGAVTTLAAAAEMMETAPSADAVLVEVGRDGGEALDRLLDQLNAAAVAGDLRSIVCMPRALIDIAAARASSSDVVLLCEAGELERVAALAELLAVRPAAAVYDRGSDPPLQLRQLSEEVGRIARVLAQLSSGEGGTRAGPPIASPTARADLPSIQAVRAAIRARRLREQFFAADLFADPAWDMLLDLLVARIERRPVAVSSLCIAASVPPTTALRWIKKLTDDGLFLRTADPRDGRRVFVELAPHVVDAMSTYFTALEGTG